jgi:hypothetical protein
VIQALKAGSDTAATVQLRQEETTLRQAVLERRREVQTRLDIEEQRLTGVENID